MATEREAKPGQRILPEFVVVGTIGQTVGGKVVKFDSNSNGAFVVLSPVCLRTAIGGAWYQYASAAFGIGADIGRKVDARRDVGKFLLFQFVDTEATNKGSMKRIFKVIELDPPEVAALLRKAENKDAERAAAIAASGGSVVPPLFPPA